MDITIQIYYFEEVMGPIQFYTDGQLKLKDEDIYMLLSSMEPYSESMGSKISGPSYIKNNVIMVYSRSIANPEARDERISLMGTDCWVLVACEKNLEIVLLSQIEIIKTIFDIEFENILELNQLTPEIGMRMTYALQKVFQDEEKNKI